ncbi:MAG: NmrA family NAD(P)-binding protein [Caulobacterales bacterium]
MAGTGAKKILVTAAHGNQGRVLLPRLRDAGFSVRALRATPGREDEVKNLGASEVLVGDATNRDLLRRAVEGVDAIYYVCPTANAQEREMGAAIIDTARELGTPHFIYSSVLHPIASKMLQHKAKRDVEEYLLEANIPYTVLQPADYMVPFVFQAAFSSGLWEQLYDLNRGQAMVDLHDVADVAVKVALEKDAHFGATYQLCAPGNHNAYDIAGAITRVTGKAITPTYVTPDAYFERFYGFGQGERFRYPLALIRAVGLWYSQYVFAGNPNVLGWLLGRAPTTLDQFIAREWDVFQK